MPQKVYCLKCKSHQELKVFEPVTMKNGRAAVRGVCPSCDGPVFAIIKKQREVQA